MPATAENVTPSQIEIDAARTRVSEVAAYLQRHLGQRLTAYLSGLKDPKAVGQWAKGRVEPRDVAALRLRHGYQAVRLIAEAFGDETAKAWLVGSNSQLAGEAPAFVLRHARLPEEVTPVVLAAAGFAESGHGRKSPRAAARTGKGRPTDAHRLARLLAAEVGRYEDDRPEVSEGGVAAELEKELRGGQGPMRERMRALELAQDEIADRLAEIVDHLKSDLAGGSERADR